MTIFKKIIRRLRHGYRSICDSDESGVDDIRDHIDHLSDGEKSLVGKAIKLYQSRVSDIMVPRGDIIAVSDASNIRQIIDIIASKEHTRIPIYTDSLDNIIGFVHAKDVIKYFVKNDEFFIRAVMRKVIYTSCNTKASELMFMMQKARVHFAVVLDEYGGTSGIVTIEDVLEEVVGEIEDEHDVAVDDDLIVKQVGESEFEVSARVTIEAFEQKTAIKFPNSEEFDTIAGLIISVASRIPKTGEVIAIGDNIEVKILESSRMAVQLVCIKTLNRVEQ